MKLKKLKVSLILILMLTGITIGNFGCKDKNTETQKKETTTSRQADANLEKASSETNIIVNEALKNEPNE